MLHRHQYLLKRKALDNLPSVWMPRKVDVMRYDSGLKEAIRRYFGSFASLCKVAGLIEYREWNYLERQHDLMITLREYADANLDGNYTILPSYSRLRDEGSTQLLAFIQSFGGHKFVAGKFGMQNEVTERNVQTTWNWGPFDLEYGIALMDFVRNDQMQKNPPISDPAIFMPTRKQFLDLGGSHGRYLHEKTMEFGGYESVARRLGLEWRRE